MHKYKSLIAWQRAHQLALSVLQRADAEYSPQARPLLDQLRRAAISVEVNLVEGYALGSTAQFRKHLRIALGSAAEAECLIALARESEYLQPDSVEDLETLCTETLRLLRGLLNSQMKLAP